MNKLSLTKDTDLDEYLEAVVRQEYKKQLNNSKGVETIKA